MTDASPAALSDQEIEALSGHAESIISMIDGDPDTFLVGVISALRQLKRQRDEARDALLDFTFSDISFDDAAMKHGDVIRTALAGRKEGADDER